MNAVMDAKKVGEIIGLHPREVLKLRRAGKITGIKLGPRTIRFEEKDVASYLAAHRQEAAPMEEV